MSCFAKAIKKSLPVDPDCLTKAEGKWSSACAKADSKGPCPGACGNSDPPETEVDNCVTTLNGDVVFLGCSGKFSSNIAKSLGKTAGSELSCEAKELSKPGTASACRSKALSKFASTVGKNGGCASGDSVSDMDNCVDTIKNLLTAGTTTTIAGTTSTTSTTIVATTTTTSTTIAGTTTTTSTTLVVTTTTTSTSLPTSPCCDPVQIGTTSGPGTLKVGGFAPFPFPAGVTVTIDAGAADAQCAHPATVPAGGFIVPAFCIPALNYTSSVQATGCESGSAIGKGVVWDGNTSAAGGTPLANVNKDADSSDGTCDPGSGICANDDNNLLGKIVTTRSAGGDGTMVNTQLDIPAHSRTWQDAAGCPGNGVYNPGEGDALVTEFDFILSPTTGVATGAFVDMNANGCSLPTGSAGFGAPSLQCAAGASGPCSATGAPAAGPCCVVGQNTTTATVGEAFSNSFPLYDLGFINVIPSSITSCGTPGSDTCVLTTNPCLGSASGAFVD